MIGRVFIERKYVLLLSVVLVIYYPMVWLIEALLNPSIFEILVALKEKIRRRGLLGFVLQFFFFIAISVNELGVIGILPEDIRVLAFSILRRLFQIFISFILIQMNRGV
jgi:hypothetical protein